MVGIVICPVIFYLPKFCELRTTDVYGSIIVKPDCVSVLEAVNATNFEGEESASFSHLISILTIFFLSSPKKSCSGSR